MRAEKWGIHSHGNGGRCRHTARCAGTSGRGWRVAGMGDFHVSSALLWERRWGAGENIERDSTMNGYRWGGGRKEKGK